MNNITILSYVPLFNPSLECGDMIDENYAHKVFSNHADDGKVVKAIFFNDIDDKLNVLLAMENAREVFDHAMIWSHGAPTEWFIAEVCKSESHWCIVLMPSTTLAVERWKLSRLLATGDADKAQISVASDPIRFVSSDYINKVDEIDSKIGVFFFDAEDILNIQEADVFHLGDFNVVCNEDCSDFTKSLV